MPVGSRNTLRVGFCLCVVTIVGCTTWRPATAPVPELLADDSSATLRITRKDNTSVVLTAPVILHDSIVGSTQSDPALRVAIATADVMFVDQRKFSIDKTLDNTLTATRVTMGVLLLATTIMIFRIL